MTLSRSNGQSILLRIASYNVVFTSLFHHTRFQIETFRVKWFFEDGEPNFICLFDPVTSLKIQPFSP